MRLSYSTILCLTLAAGALSIALVACTARVDTRGNLPDPENLSQIKAGQSSREDVSQLLGSPSTVGNFTGETWYYISNRTETTAFFEPKVEERHVVIVRFDDQGKVADLKTLGLEDGQSVELVDRVTPTSGNEFTFFQQIFGNLGRFNGKKSALP